MTTIGQVSIDEQNPWPGLGAFDEAAAQFFNGRRNESAELRRLVMNAPLTLLFGASGLGKTSLVQAGLFPLLRKEHVLPIYVRLDLRDRHAPLIDQVTFALQAQFEARRIDAPSIDGDDLWRYLHRGGLEMWSEQNQLLTPLFVFDQFEEVFTLGADNAAGVARLRIDLADLVENRMPAVLAGTLQQHEAAAVGLSLDSQRYKVLLSFREDFLPAVEGWKRDLPSILRNRLRLLPMSGEQAFDAVHATGPRLVDEQLARRIVRFVAAAQEDGAGRAAEAGGSLTELAVEPALLSLVCHGLNEKRKALSKATFDDALLSGSGQSIISDYYREAVGDLSERVRRFIEKELITERGFRKPCDLDDARSVHGVTDRELRLLVDRRLLRIEPQRGSERVELTHDLLTRVVREHRDRQREKERLARQRRRVAIVGAIGVLLAGLVVVFGLLYRRAQQDKRFAESQKERADTALQRMTEALAREERSKEAEKGQREIAQERSVRAEQLTHLAISRQLAAQAASRVDESPDLSLLLGVEAFRAADTAESRNRLLSGLEHNPHLAAFLGHGRPHIAISPDGRSLAAGTEDETVTIWDLATHQPRAVFRVPFQGIPDDVRAVAFSPDGKTLASGAVRGTIRLWDIATRKLLRELAKVHANGGVGQLMFAPNGKVLASGGAGHLVLWDLATGQALSDRETMAWSLAFSPDGTKLASSGAAIALWDGATGQTLGPPLTHEPSVSNNVAFSADGSMVGAGTVDGGIALWNVATRDLIASILPDDLSVDKGSTAEANRTAHMVTDVAFSPDGQTLVSGSVDHSVSLWRIVARGGGRGRGGNSPRQRIATLQGHKAGVWSVAFLKDGRTLASAGEDRSIILWNVEIANRQQTARPFQAKENVLSNTSPTMRYGLRSPAYSPNGQHLVAIWDIEDSRIVRWDVRTGKQIGALLKPPVRFLSQVTFGASGEMLALGSEQDAERGELRVWNIATGTPVGSPFRGLELPIALSPDGTMLASSADGRILLWDVATGQPLANRSIVLGKRRLDSLDPLLFAPSARAKTLAFSHDGRILAAGLCAGFMGSAQLIGGRYSGTDCRRGEIDLWDLGVRQPMSQRFAAHGEAAVGMTFSPDGRTLASLGRDGVLLRDAASGEPIGPLLEVDHSISSLAFSPDSRTLTLGASNGPVTTWNVDPESWAARSCRIANRNLTRLEWEQYLHGQTYRRTCPALPPGN